MLVVVVDDDAMISIEEDLNFVRLEEALLLLLILDRVQKNKSCSIETEWYGYVVISTTTSTVCLLNAVGMAAIDKAVGGVEKRSVLTLLYLK